MTRPLSILPVLVSALSLAAVLWWSSRQDRPILPDGAEGLVAIALAGAVYAAATLGRAERWHRILGHAGLPARRRDSYALTTVGYMGNNVLPARAGELLRVFLMAPRARSRRRDVLATIVAERLLDVVALLLVFGVLAVGVVRRTEVPAQGLVFVGALATAALVAGGLVLSSRMGARVLGARVRGLLHTLSGPARELLSARGAALLGLSVVIWTLEAGVYYAVGLAVDLGMGPLHSLYVVALTNLFALVPAAPGYVGTFDAAVIFGVEAAGVAGSAAVGYLLLLRFVLFVPITVVGLGALVARYGGLSVYRAARLDGLRA
jgi:uncharacterized protein (TIRG00374 family)